MDYERSFARCDGYPRLCGQNGGGISASVFAWTATWRTRTGQNAVVDSIDPGHTGQIGIFEFRAP